MKPTPEQLTRAAELAPRVAEIAGLEIRGVRCIQRWLVQLDDAVPIRTEANLLDPRAFQAVLRALPAEIAMEVLRSLEPRVNGDPTGMVIWLSGVEAKLAFYEALVEQSA